MSIYADSVVYNANVITMNPAVPSASAVAVKDGRFMAVGMDRDILEFKGRATEVLDAGGKTVLPGFIDAHTHVMSSGVRHVAQEDCDLRSIGEIQEGLKGRAVDTPAGGWVLGFKFDDTKTSEQRFLHRRDLDAVSNEHPVMVAHQAGHVYFFNTLGLRRAGFNDDTPDPSGGRLGRDPDTGELDGRVYGAAIYPVLREVLPAHTDDDRRRGLALICHMFAEAGLTSVHDAMVSNDDLRVYQEAKDAGELPLRVYLLMYRDHFPALRDAGSPYRSWATTGSASGGSRWWPTGPSPPVPHISPSPISAAAVITAWPLWTRRRRSVESLRCTAPASRCASIPTATRPSTWF